MRFIEKMYERNGSAVFPPMAFDGEAIVCVTQEAIYEYKNGEMNEIIKDIFDITGFDDIVNIGQ